MRLVSKFKDFYDFCIYQYGIDPTIYYERTKINFDNLSCDGYDIKQTTHHPNAFLNKKAFNIFDIETHINHIIFERDPFSWRYKPDEYSFGYIFVCGECHLAVVINTGQGLMRSKKYKIISKSMLKENEELLLKIANNINDIKRVVSKYDKDELIDVVYSHCKFENKIVNDVSKVIKHPVFSYSIEYACFTVDENIPCLSEVGYSCEDPIQFYQKLCWYISNMINNSSDIKPPVEIGNSDKIVKHGFDLKTSFRNM